MLIPFNKPYFIGTETRYIEEAVRSGKLSGDGIFTRRCEEWLQHQLGVPRVLLTTSGTDALELAALLLDLQPGDEVLLPSFTFSSTATAFVLRGAKLIFVDSSADGPAFDTAQLETLVTPRTRAIVPVHYAGLACDMDAVRAVAERHHLAVVEDAAQALGGGFRGRPLGTLGALGAFSFHETKNVTAGGEGGMLVINEPQLIARAEILREKGTNRAAFFRGEVAKYSWVDVGSSFLPAEINAAFLWAQLEELEIIQQRRQAIWARYFAELQPLAQLGVRLPFVPDYTTQNGHLFYLVCRSLAERTALIAELKQQGITAIFHYQPLHSSPYYAPRHDGRLLPWAEHYADCLVRLPLYTELEESQQQCIVRAVLRFYQIV
ncbi:dTDP-4-amino-4,6-dideoxygalactose transaminase [Hymenobacter sp. BT186]|uniref:dTDP-4-amino-4,6-dideoxygalactose transaminase n=1 Tax=Hymenobacter telluris TaxID=2816474 RepID=A0A939ET98_9BACT|nr:dTDP-4-amino-4,6-dideoxygalactose transaminase [Hymenobacter telluris]MBO0357359.1 dTDP-4-amino-4,6-dideoxygalactose transaminase [Hymenobacter telluris]MBW3373385.1 dTDP-4-amino-4,6-dideoxygalactose transaminase [Hymenobacter norwichensis]